MKYNFYSLLSLLSVLAFNVDAQILDDSTKQVYGYHSTRYVTESSIYKDDTTKFSPDTIFDPTVHRYDKQYFKQNIYQNLGNLGTASKPVYWEQPKMIGYTFGYHVYDQYASNVLNTKYFDTKSPYTSLRYIQGGTGENALNFDFSRNIGSLFNLGVTLQRLTSVKQIGRKVQRDRNADQWDFGFNASFHTKNKRYIALTSFARFSTWVRETGGIRPDEAVFDQNTLDNYEESPVKMSDSARTIDDRTNWRLYHQYGILNQNRLNIYHIFSYSNHYIGFNDRKIQDYINGKTMFLEYVYPRFRDSSQTVYRANFNSVANTLGVKTDLNKLKLSTYVLFENNAYKQIIKSDSTDKLSLELMKAGANAQFYLNQKTFINGSFVNQLSQKASTGNSDKTIYVVDNKDYLFNIDFVSNLIKAGLSTSKYAPTLQQTQYSSNNYEWKNGNLKPILSQQMYVKLMKEIRKQKFEIGVTHTVVENYVYYLDTAAISTQWKESNVVRQDSVGFQVTTADLVADFAIADKLFINNQLKYSIRSGSDVYRVPALYISSMIYYQIKFAKDLALQFGFDIHYRSAYKADQYAAPLQQFVVQNKFTTKAFTVVDAFINLKVKRATVWVKGSQVNQYLGQQVYFVTPYYPGMSMAFHFGVNWPFFD